MVFRHDKALFLLKRRFPELPISDFRLQCFKPSYFNAKPPGISSTKPQGISVLNRKGPLVITYYNTIIQYTYVMQQIAQECKNGSRFKTQVLFCGSAVRSSTILCMHKSASFNFYCPTNMYRTKNTVTMSGFFRVRPV